MQMEHKRPTSHGSERIEHDQSGFYLPAMPPKRLVGLLRRIVAGHVRYDLDES